MAAAALLKLTAILFLLLSFHSQTSAFSTDVELDNDEDGYVLDAPLPVNLRSRSRFLVSIIKKGTHCDPITNNICNGISANNGTSLLHCCKKHCRNVLRDQNNCGRCGKKCRFGQRCCHGTCTDVAYNVNHCGKCDEKCLPGVKCEFGSCGYA